MVSVWVNQGGELDEDRSDVTNVTRSSPELSALLALGEYLSTGNAFVVKKIRFGKDFEQGYIGVYWTRAIPSDDLKFVMHLTLASWNPDDWLANASFGFEPGVDFAALMKDLEAWMIATSPELMSIDKMQMKKIIGTLTRSGRWRVIMKMHNNALATRLRLLRNQLEHVLSVGFFNTSGGLHFSLDTWWGIMPPYMNEGRK